MANKRIIELNERTSINLGDFLMVDDATGSRKLSMSTLFNYLTFTSLIFVDTLPTTDIEPNVIYLVPHSGSTTQWDEYIYIDNQWNLIGTSTIDLTSIYQTKTDNNLETDSKQVVGAINEINSDLSNKVTFHHERGMKTFSGVEQTIATITVAAGHCVIATAACEFVNVGVESIKIVDNTTADVLASTATYGGITAVLSEGTYNVKVKTVSAGSNPFILTKVDFAIN